MNQPTSARLQSMRWREPRAILGMREGVESETLKVAFERLGIESYRPQNSPWVAETARRADTVAAIIDTRGFDAGEMAALVERTAAHRDVPVAVIIAREATETFLAAGAVAVAREPLGYGACFKLIHDLAYPVDVEVEEPGGPDEGRKEGPRIQYVRPEPAEGQVSGREVLQERIAKVRGKLKIYIGAAPGVGKTFAMLREGHDRMARSEDVAVGVVETHGRPETQAQLEGLAMLPRRVFAYKGAQISDMDLDAILERRPALVLVDELAHTNAPGSLDRKRYQDVELIRIAGSSVLSTLNIQHLESLNNLIERITGVKVRETVPDSVLLDADEVVLVDLPPEDLQMRLQAGKIYAPEKITQALENFFTTHNLTALRELALRELADRVDIRLEEVRSALGRGEEPPGIQERVLACISASPYAGRVIRRAARLASRLNAELTVLHVASEKLADGEARALQVSRDLAESLEAKVVTVRGPDIPEAIARHAQDAQSTVIVLGESGRARWRALFEPSIQDAILARTANIDVLTVASRAEEPTS